MKMLLEKVPHYVLVDLNGKYQGKLLRDSAAAPAWILSPGFNNGRHLFRRRQEGYFKRFPASTSRTQSQSQSHR